MSPKYLWQYLHEDRHKVQSEMRRHYNLPPLMRHHETEEAHDEEPERERTENRIFPKRIFVIKLQPEVWKQLDPIPVQYHRQDRASKTRSGLQLQEGWESVLHEQIYDQHRLPCAYTFKSRVNLDPNLASCFVSITASCSDCNGEGEGKVFVRPAPGEVVLLEWLATDSRGVPHSKKSQLRGERRKEVGQACSILSPSTFHRIEAAKTQQMGAPESPLLPRVATLRKAKQNYSDHQLKVAKVDDEITTVEVMKRSVPYAGSIHDIGSDQIFVPYDTPSQLLVYKSYRQNGYTRLTADATGSLIERVARRGPGAGLSRHLFLYELVLSGENIQIPVSQLISERQDSEAIMYWVRDWLRRGGQAPHEIVTDASAALLLTFSVVFGKCHDLKEYLQKQYMCLTGQASKPAECFIRKDVAHLTKNIAQWKIWGEDCLKKIREFYVRCFAVLVQCTTLTDFTNYLECILTISQADTIGVTAGGETVAAESCLQKLCEAIGKADTFSLEITEIDERAGQNPDDFDCMPFEDIPCCIKDYIKCINDTATEKAAEEGDRVSPYKSEKVHKKFLEYAYDFVLWTAVMVQFHNSPFKRPSSAASESEFADIKCRILKDSKRPLLLHKMLQKHLDCIDGQMKIVAAKLSAASPASISSSVLTSTSSSSTTTTASANFVSSATTSTSSEMSARPLYTSESSSNNCTRRTEQSDQSSEEDTNLDVYTENWRNLADKGRKTRSKTKFFKPSIELRLAVENETLSPPKLRLLINGNLARPCVVESKTVYVLRNTCNTDSILHLIATSYIEYPNIRTYIDANEEDNHLLQCAKSLATVGAVQETYVLRTKIAEEHFTTSALPVLQVRDTRHRKGDSAKVIDCLGILQEQSQQLLSKTPACRIKTSCTGSQIMHIGPEPEIVVLQPMPDTLTANGIRALGIACNDAIKYMDGTICGAHNCSAKVLSVQTVNVMIFIDIGDCVGLGQMQKEYDLKELPEEIRLGNENPYRLCGVIGYQSRNHVVAYARRLQGNWEKFDDLRSGVIPLTPDTRVRPATLFYCQVLCNDV